MQYAETIASSRRQMSRMVRIWNAQYLSRLGFTLQDYLKSEKEFSDVIDKKGEEIGKNHRCVLEAKDTLENYGYETGVKIKEIAEKSRETVYDHENLVYHYLDELGLVIDDFRLDFSKWLSRENSMTNFKEIEDGLKIEFRLIEILFEISVDEIIEEIKLFETHVQLSQVEAFKALTTIYETFRSNGRRVIQNLNFCNEIFTE